jgi:hypothetical protein
VKKNSPTSAKIVSLINDLNSNYEVLDILNKYTSGRLVQPTTLKLADNVEIDLGNEVSQELLKIFKSYMQDRTNAQLTRLKAAMND